MRDKTSTTIPVWSYYLAMLIIISAFIFACSCRRADTTTVVGQVKAFALEFKGKSYIGLSVFGNIEENSESGQIVGAPLETFNIIWWPGKVRARLKDNPSSSEEPQVNLNTTLTIKMRPRKKSLPGPNGQMANWEAIEILVH